MKDRRGDPRFAPPAVPGLRATLRPGCAVALINVSAAGILLQAPRPLRPGGRVHLQVNTLARRWALAAHVLRCVVWSLDAAEGVIYRAALAFDHSVDWCWAEPTRRVHTLPEHARPTELSEGKRLPVPRRSLGDGAWDR